MKIVDTRKKDWFCVSNKLVDNENLSTFEKCVYLMIARHIDEGITIRQLAYRFNVSEEEIKHTLGVLMLEGFRTNI